MAAKRREMEKRENELALELEQIEKQLEETRSIVTKEIEKPVVVPPPLLRYVSALVCPCLGMSLLRYVSA